MSLIRENLKFKKRSEFSDIYKIDTKFISCKKHNLCNCKICIILDDGFSLNLCKDKLSYSYWGYIMPSSPTATYLIEVINSNKDISITYQNVLPLLPQPTPSYYLAILIGNPGFDSTFYTNQSLVLSNITNILGSIGNNTTENINSLNTMYISTNFTGITGTSNAVYYFSPLQLYDYCINDVIQIFKPQESDISSNPNSNDNMLTISGQIYKITMINQILQFWNLKSIGIKGYQEYKPYFINEIIECNPNSNYYANLGPIRQNFIKNRAHFSIKSIDDLKKINDNTKENTKHTKNNTKIISKNKNLNIDIFNDINKIFL